MAVGGQIRASVKKFDDNVRKVTGLGNGGSAAQCRQRRLTTFGVA
jgi:hypothetical protein